MRRWQWRAAFLVVVVEIACPLAVAQTDAEPEAPLSADEEHEALFLENRFPSATTWCATPHSC